jgi:hypothetical protein
VGVDTETTRQAEERDLSPRASVQDGVSYAVMMGCGETYFGPFGIFLSASTLQVGLLASLPQLFGAVMQWLFSSHILYLMIIQTYAGFVWSGFSLAAANFMFDAVTPPKRARCVAYQGLVNGFFILTGSLAGGYAANHLPSIFSLGSWTWKPPFILPVVFLISGLIRVVAAAILLREFKEVRPVEPIRHRELIFRVSRIKPIAGVTFSLFTGLFRGQRRDKANAGEKKTPGVSGKNSP